MPVVAFDTLKFANRLKLVGVDPKQAEAEAEIFSEIFELNLRELLTKEDLKCEISDLRKDIDAKIEKSKFDLIKWIIGLLIAQSGLLFTILKFFSKTGG